MGEITYFYKWGMYVGLITHFVNLYKTSLGHPSNHPIFQGANYVSFMESIAISKKRVWSVQKSENRLWETQNSPRFVCSISFRHLKGTSRRHEVFLKTKDGCGGCGSPNDGMSPLDPPPKINTKTSAKSSIYKFLKKPKHLSTLLNLCRCFFSNRTTCPQQPV